MDVERTMSMTELYSRGQQVAGSLVATKIKCTIRTSSTCYFFVLLCFSRCDISGFNQDITKRVIASECSHSDNDATLHFSSLYLVDW